MIRLGILDFDTSHVIQFTMRLNHVEVAQDQWVDGAKVVVGCPGESKHSPDRIAGYTDKMKQFGVPLVEKPEQMLGKVDAMIIAANDGSVHWERARPFLEAGLPCFVDKPFACSTADARRMIELADKKKVPIFSTSALRYAPEVIAAADAKTGKVVGCGVYGPASLHPRNPGLFNYGIHVVEVLYTLMGPGCDRVNAVSDAGADAVTGHWKDGRLATVRGIRGGAAGYGFTLFGEKAVKAGTVGTTVIYRELLKKMIETFQTGRPAVPPAETLEIIAFIEAANASAANHGAVQTVKA